MKEDTRNIELDIISDKKLDDLPNNSDNSEKQDDQEQPLENNVVTEANKPLEGVVTSSTSKGNSDEESTQQPQNYNILKKTLTIFQTYVLLGEMAWLASALDKGQEKSWNVFKNEKQKLPARTCALLLYFILEFVIFWDAVFRGIAQVVFINNPIAYVFCHYTLFLTFHTRFAFAHYYHFHYFSGIMIWVALAVDSIWNALLGLLGTTISTIVATPLVFNLDRSQYRNGLYGYNGVLVGNGMALFLSSSMPRDWWLICIPTIIMSIVSTVLRVTFLNLFPKNKQAQMPMFTLPFNFSALIFLAASLQFSFFQLDELVGAKLLKPLPFNINSGAYDATLIGLSIPKGISQIYLVENWTSGVIMFVAMFISCPWTGFISIIGSASGMAFALGLLFFLTCCKNVAAVLAALDVANNLNMYK